MPIPVSSERIQALRAEHGTYTAVEIAKAEAREIHLNRLRGAIYDLAPSSPDFGVDLRNVLSDIVDLLD